MICHVLLMLSTLLISGIRTDNEDTYLTTPQLIQKYGYPVEVHPVTTEDGYILEMHRIPYSPKSPKANNKSAVFLQHGLFSTSSDWIILGPGVSLGYLLADAGYDVWLGNARGNTYSKKHKTLSTSCFAYWNFSWHEMGVYDLPAVIDHVLATTGQSDIFYVGHSMGTTIFYVLESEKPEYSSKVRHMISLGPIAYMEHTASNVASFAYLPGVQFVVKKLEYLGLGEIFPTNNLTIFILDLLCSEQSVTHKICMDFIYALIGYDSAEINKTMLPVIFGHIPAGTSIRTFLHYAQELSTTPHDFYKYNYYGNNYIHYGSINPPIYNLTSIRTPITLMYCYNDNLAHPTDVFRLSKVLPNVKLYEVTLKTCNHQVFVWGRHMKTLVHDQIMKILKETD